MKAGTVKNLILLHVFFTILLIYIFFRFDPWALLNGFRNKAIELGVEFVKVSRIVLPLFAAHNYGLCLLRRTRWDLKQKICLCIPSLALGRAVITIGSDESTYVEFNMKHVHFAS